MQVKEVLRVKGNTLYTVAPDSLLSEAVITMADQDIGSLIVMEGGKLVGMLTFREVIAMLARRQKERRIGPTPTFAEIRVKDAMHGQPILTHPEMDVDELRSIMLQHHARYVPVMEGDLLLGVISFHDVAKAVLEERNFENRMLKGYIKNWPA
jgi:CBS domain-containing protein